MTRLKVSLILLALHFRLLDGLTSGPVIPKVMSDAESDLRAQLERTEAGLRTNHKRGKVLHTTSWRVKRQKALCADGFEFSHAARHMASLLYVLAGYQAAPAVAYVAHVLRKKGQNCIADETLRHHVEAAFLDCDLDVITDILNESGSSQPRELAKAWGWYTEWQLFSWVLSKNRAHGVAPMTAIVLASHDRLRMQAPVDFRPVPRGGPDMMQARVWAQRWRLRWGARHGNLRTVEGISVGEMRQKAPTAYTQGPMIG